MFYCGAAFDISELKIFKNWFGIAKPPENISGKRSKVGPEIGGVHFALKAKVKCPDFIASFKASCLFFLSQ